MASKKYEQQQAIAKAAGYPSYYAYRKAQAKAQGYTGVGEQRRARAEGRRSPMDPGKANQGKAPASNRRQVFDTQAGRVVKSTRHGKGFGVLEAQVRNADPDAVVTILVDVRGPGGDVHRVTFFGHGGIRAHVLAQAIDAAGGLADYLEGETVGKSGDGTSFSAGDIVSVQLVIA